MRAPIRVPAEFPVTGGNLAIVGEAPGSEEQDQGRPFVGASGQLLDRILSETGILRSECMLTNVFTFKLPGNNVNSICTTKVKLPDKGKGYPHPAVAPGHYVKYDYLEELDRLKLELEAAKPNLVLALGNTACWALLATTGITALRGAVAESTLVPGLKVLPAIHPAAVLRQWDFRVLLTADCLKAKKQMAYPEIRRPKRRIAIEPTVEDVENFCAQYKGHKFPIAVDIETVAKRLKSGLLVRQITCIGFAPYEDYAIVIPFVDRRKPDYQYWETTQDEIAVLRAISALVSDPHTPMVLQNGLYDAYWKYNLWKMPVYGYTEDTMALHHALHPELNKGLGFLGSLYTDEVAWKLMRPRGAKTEKTDE